MEPAASGSSRTAIPMAAATQTSPPSIAKVQASRTGNKINPAFSRQPAWLSTGRLVLVHLVLRDPGRVPLYGRAPGAQYSGLRMLMLMAEQLIGCSERGNNPSPNL